MERLQETTTEEPGDTMSDPIRPEFIRLPSGNEKCPYSGYSRTGLYNICVPCRVNNHRPPVPAKCDRKRGNLRGIWLIPYAQLIAYINNLPTPGMAKDDGQVDA